VIGIVIAIGTRKYNDTEFQWLVSIIWSAPAERSGDGALDNCVVVVVTPSQSGVAVRLPPHSKMLFFNLNPKVFNDRVGQNFMRQARRLVAGLLFRDAIIHGYLEIFTLSDVADAFEAQQLDGMFNRFALRIEDAWL